MIVTVLTDEERARDNHVFVCQQTFLNLIVDIPTTPKHVATLPCNLSLVACFLALMFHKAVWLHTQDVAGPVVNTLVQTY